VYELALPLGIGLYSGRWRSNTFNDMYDHFINHFTPILMANPSTPRIAFHPQKFATLEIWQTETRFVRKMVYAARSVHGPILQCEAYLHRIAFKSTGLRSAFHNQNANKELIHQ